MKKGLLLGCLLVSIFSIAQPAQSFKPGTLFKKEFTQIGELTAYNSLPIQIEIFKLNDLKLGSQVKSIRFSTAYTSALLESDEVDGLLFSLAKMQESIKDPVPVNYTEYVFYAKSGFKIIVFVMEKKYWSITLELNSLGGKGSSIDFDKASEYLPKLIDFLSKAKAAL